MTTTTPETPAGDDEQRPGVTPDHGEVGPEGPADDPEDHTEADGVPAELEQTRLT